MKLQRRSPFWLLVASGVLFSTGQIGIASGQTPSGVNADGSVLIKQLTVPLSNLLSPEGKTYMIHLLRDQPFSGGPRADQDIKGYRARQDEIMNYFLEPIRQRYPVKVEEQAIGGISTQIITPLGGVAEKNRNHILINVHGGGFLSGAKTASLVESIPVSSVEKIKVISIDYRMGPEYKFPAASEDVAAVYKEVLKQYRPEQIGLYGCSAGGQLTGMSIAWFQAHNLPNPAAIGILCAGLGDMFAGDAAFIVGPLLGMNMPAPPPAPKGEAAPARLMSGYLSDANPKDPLVAPINSPELLKKFPPTLFVTSTRAFEFSGAISSDNALTRSGVDAELHVWDSLPHAFWYNSDLPESREVYQVIANFFDKHLH